MLQLFILSFSFGAYIKFSKTGNIYKIEFLNTSEVKKIPFFDDNYVVLEIKSKNIKIDNFETDKTFIKDFQIIKSKNCIKIVLEKSKKIKRIKIKKYKNKTIVFLFKRGYPKKFKKLSKNYKTSYKKRKFYKVKIIKVRTDPIYNLIVKELAKERRLQILKPIVVVIDPGHGGKDPGAISNGLKEKNVNLRIARRLKRLLENSKFYKVYLTRYSDRYVDLYTRTVYAIKKKADIFISIHCNASENTYTRGTYIYTLNLKGAKSKLARLVERRENKAVIKAVKVSSNPFVNKVVAELAINTTMTEGLNFAYILKKELSKITSVKDIDSANFAVLKTPGIPSVLIETAYITNKKDANLLKSKIFIENFAAAIYNAIEDYFFNYQNLVLK
ncbi:MAG: N-acetylmuramoyl-L-alanine amidase [Aquificota bacterium]|nr:MAG: N-acetylmuramoyl-L-alanine amidase [Aquificota bacterium]